MIKNCLICGSLFHKKYTESVKYFSTKKYCSQKCLGLSMKDKPSHHKNKFLEELFTKEYLQENYIDKKKSTYTIAKEIGCDATVVNKYLRKWGIPIRTISEAKKGIVHSEESNEKRSIKRMGFKFSEETKEKMSLSRVKWYQSLSEEERAAFFAKVVASKSFNSWEVKIISLIERHNLPFKYVGDGKLWLTATGQHFNPDFVSTDNSCTFIEVYCDFYKEKSYGSVEEYLEKRANLASSLGFKIVFLGDKEILATNWEEICLNKIREVVLK